MQTGRHYIRSLTSESARAINAIHCDRKHVPCFYRVIQTRVEVWENEKCRGNTNRRRVFPQLFRVLSNFPRREKGKQLVNFDYQNANSLCSRHHYVNSARAFLGLFSTRLGKSLAKFYKRHDAIIEKYSITLREMRLTIQY